MHVQTLLIALAVSCFVQFISLFIQYRTTDCKGLGWWTLGSGLCALSFVADHFRNVPFDGNLPAFAGIALLVFSMALHYVGVQRFLGRREQRAQLIALCTVTVVVIGYFTFGHDDARGRVVTGCFALAVISLQIGRALSTREAKEAAVSSSVLGGIFIANGLYYLFRGLSWLGAVPGGGFFASTPDHSAKFLVALTMTSLWTFGFITLVNQRLSRKNRESAEHFQLIFNTSPDAALITSLDKGLFVDINETFTALTGFTSDDVMGKSVLDINLWSEPRERTKFITTLKKDGFCNGMDVIFLSKEGNPLTCMLSARIMKLQGTLHIVTMIRDIGERKRMEKALEESNRTLEALSRTDALTGIANRRCFDEVLEREFARNVRTGSSLSLILLDVDHFKFFNDHYGHLGGDDCLRQLARALSGALRRPADLATRFGGEEFACILPETEADGALRVAERIRQRVRELAIPHGFSPVAEYVTVSLGAATVHCGADISASELVAEADDQLYFAKESGRNRVQCKEIGIGERRKNEC